MSRSRGVFEGLAIAVAVAGGWLLLAGQVERVPQGPTRAFHMGLAYWPPQGAGDAIIKAGVGATLESSELVLVQVPWHPARTPASEMTAWMSGVASNHGHRVAVSLDWMEASRDVLLGDDWSFADQGVRARFLDDVRAVASAVKPSHISLGVEVDGLALQNPEEFGSFVTLYAEAYRQIKAVSHLSQVGVSFQFEAMLAAGLIDADAGRAGPVHAFGPLLDFLGVSLYPCLAYPTVSDIPPAYLAPLAGAGRPLVVMETGWPAGPDAPDQQTAYLDWLVTQPEAQQIDLMVWISTTDLGDGYVPSRQGPACPSDVGAWRGGLGLWSVDVKPKPAAARWVSLLRTRRISAAPLAGATAGPIDPLTSPLY
jgi:hypothetical protein